MLPRGAAEDGQRQQQLLQALQLLLMPPLPLSPLLLHACVQGRNRALLPLSP